MKIIIDAGNTFVKAGVFENKNIFETFRTKSLSVPFLEQILKKHPHISNVLLSSVLEISEDIKIFLRKFKNYVIFDSSTKIPVINKYKTPETLGNDRLAGVVGAFAKFPGENILVIDAGSCLTFDFINGKGEYTGGSISPGLNMRFNALHTFTGKLPLVSLSEHCELTGTDTQSSILSGVINGLVFETDEVIIQYQKKYPSLKVLVCGGDGSFLADRLKSSIFAIPELVLIGLNEILDYNR